MDPLRRVYGIEWVTLGLILLTYGAWALLTIFADNLPLWLVVPGLTLTLVLHSSLQHESIHGHPFPNRTLSEALMTPGLGLAIPYGRFRDLHLLHHKDANLTDPYDDPESNYYDPPLYDSMSTLWRRVLVFNNTLAGRLLIGPVVGLNGFFRTEVQLIRAGSARVIAHWLIHGTTVVLVLVWLGVVGTIPMWAYLLSAYGALSVLKIRTFVEHQAHALASGRSVIIEDRGPLAFLFLNNNLHSVHHTHPGVAWYDLPKLFQARRAAYLQRNRGYYFRSYGAVARAYFLRPKDPVAHPLPPVPRRQS